MNVSGRCCVIYHQREAHGTCVTAHTFISQLAIESKPSPLVGEGSRVRGCPSFYDVTCHAEIHLQVGRVIHLGMIQSIYVVVVKVFSQIEIVIFVNTQMSGMSCLVPMFLAHDYSILPITISYTYLNDTQDNITPVFLGLPGLICCRTVTN
jgi:hypothetical protein